MNRLSISVCMVVAILSAGCSASVTSASSPMPATMLLTPTSTALPLSATPFPTQTRTPLPPTLTPLPVLREPGDIKTKLLELLQNNGGCQLPCLLGNTPGIVSLQETKNFLEQFGLMEIQDMIVRRATLGNLSGISFYFPYSQDAYFDAHISVYKRGNQVEALAMNTASRPAWDSHYADLLQYYLLSQILTDYGEPAQVLIWTFRNDRSRPDVTTWPFYLVLLYPDRGGYLEYEMERVPSGDKFIGCPSKSFVSVAVWSPGDNEAFYTAVQGMNNGGDLSPYKPIEEVTSLTVEEFHQVFSNPANKDCITTPIEVWPNP